MTKQVDQHSFSIEMKSKHSVTGMSFLDKENGKFFFEGFLGELKNITMIEDVMLEITGANGTLRVDISQEEMKKHLNKKKNGDQP